MHQSVREIANRANRFRNHSVPLDPHIERLSRDYKNGSGGMWLCECGHQNTIGVRESPHPFGHICCANYELVLTNNVFHSDIIGSEARKNNSYHYLRLTDTR